MKRLLSTAALGLVLSGAFGGIAARAQTGSPTALPPGGANTPGTTGGVGTTQPAGTAGTTQPAGTPGTTSPAGTAFPAGRAGAATPATRLAPATTSPLLNDPSVAPRGFDPSTGRTHFGDGTSIQQQGFGGSPGMFDRSGAGMFSRPGDAIPGQPNFGPGTTSGTLRPGGQVRGTANEPGAGTGVPGTRPFDASLDGRRVLGAPIGGGVFNPFSFPLTVPVAPFVSQTDVAPASPTTWPVTPAVQVPLPLPMDTRPAAETAFVPREAPRGEGFARATAFPVRDAATAPQPLAATVPRAERGEFVEVPTGEGSPRVAAYRGEPAAAAPRSGVTRVYPGYTLWQGYYWYHNPTSGWHYWDGQSWVRFSRVSNARMSSAAPPRTFAQ